EPKEEEPAEEPKEEEKAEEPAEEEPAEEPKEEEPAEEPKEEEPAEEPVEEEPKEEEPAEEPAEEEKVEQKPEEPVVAAAIVEEDEEEGDEDDDGFAKLRTLKRVPFVEKLEVADDDIKNKFEKLREYILAYGVHERESIAGVGFNTGRNRIIFIGFAGKKLKVHYALNFEDYDGGKIPVEKDDAKKFETMPVAIRIQSDLSYRRAKKLVDDVMEKSGVEKPEILPEDDIQVEGKYEVYPEAGYFKYRLKANNGQILIVSNSYRSKDGAMAGIETLKKNMEIGTHRVVSDKKGFAQFRIFTENDSRMVVAGEIYGNEQGAQKALESALRFYKSEKIIVLDEIPEAEVREWKAELSPITALPNGKLEIREEDGSVIGKLIASNGEALFNTQAYSSKSALLSGIANIKERAASGNVTICRDKQGRYQFKVYSDNGMVLVMGETYPGKDNALSAANSMRNFLASEYKIVDAEEAPKEE
ncbi:MAG: YegP family protein, partial [Bacilli bacterium]|nr:YegP family protein [Bacilli bacterium]